MLRRPRCLPEVSVILRSRTAAAYGRNVSTTVNVLSNTQVPPEQIAWLLNQFEALQGPSSHDWTIDVGPDVTDVVGVADGTDDLASMPRQLLEEAAEWLGGPPQYRRGDESTVPAQDRGRRDEQPEAAADGEQSGEGGV